MIILLKEGISVEADHLVCDTRGPKEVAHSFCDEQNDLRKAYVEPSP